MDDNCIDFEELVAEDLKRLTSSDTNDPFSHHESQNDEERTTQVPNLQTYDSEDTESDTQTFSGRTQSARRHFEHLRSQCLSEPKCVLETFFPLAQSLANLSQDRKSNSVRAMLLSLSSPPSASNELMEWEPQRAQSRKRKRRRVSSSQGNATTRYALRGTLACEFGFAAVVQLHTRTIQHFAVEISRNPEFQMHSNQHGKGRKGHITIQSRVALAFLHRYGEVHAFSCPTGRYSAHESPIQWLPSDTRKEHVYNMYTDRWDEILSAAIMHSWFRRPDNALSKAAFLRVWARYCPTLRIPKSGSDFCDQCTTLRNSASITTNADLKETLLAARRRHRMEAFNAFKLYREIVSAWQSAPFANPIHLVFDFAEKVLQHHLLRQPGQPHFVTGLKFDFFRGYNSGRKVCYVYGLPEGHWPNNKTANEVASMVHHTLKQHRLSGVPSAETKCLNLHADNYSGKNKNRFTLGHMLWRVCMGYENEIILRFLVAGHTKNRCDAAFGLMKQFLKHLNVFSPRDMMKVIDDSFVSNSVVCATDVEWIDWKKFLMRYYTVPNHFKLSKFHVFKFSNTYKEAVMVKALSTDDNWTKYKSMKTRVTVEYLVRESVSLLHDSSIALQITPLSVVASAQERTREAYLVKNILDRYFEGNDERRSDYFGSGSNWRNG